MSQSLYSRLLCSLSLCILVGVFFSVFVSFAHAAVTYTVHPLSINESLQARDIITKEITITNTGTQPITVFPTVNNITLGDGGEIEEFIAPVMSDRTQSLASWLEISRLGMQLRIGETKVIPLTIRVNPTPKPGVYHALVAFGNGRNRDEAEEKVQNGSAPGMIVTVTIEKETISLLKLARFVVDRFVTSSANEAVTYTFKNPGDEMLVPTGEIILYDSTGKEVATVPVNPERTTVSPGVEKEFKATVPTEGLFGKYKAFLNIEYGQTQRASIQDTSFFYVLPLKAVLILLGVVLTLVVIFAWYIHSKYFDEEILDDSEQLKVHVREHSSDAMHHDIDLKN